MSVTPTNNDVLFGRGHGAMSHPGNRLLRAMVQSRKQEFLNSCKRGGKKQIGRDIVDDIRALGGRFLMEDPESAKNKKDPEGSMFSAKDRSWIVVDTDKAVAKVLHRLRDKESGCREADLTPLPQMQQSLQMLGLQTKRPQQQSLQMPGLQANGQQQHSLQMPGLQRNGLQQHSLQLPGLQAKGPQQHSLEIPDLQMKGPQQQNLHIPGLQAKGPQQQNLQMPGLQMEGPQQHRLQMSGVQAEGPQQMQGKNNTPWSSLHDCVPTTSHANSQNLGASIDGLPQLQAVDALLSLGVGRDTSPAAKSTENDLNHPNGQQQQAKGGHGDQSSRGGSGAERRCFYIDVEIPAERLPLSVTDFLRSEYLSSNRISLLHSADGGTSAGDEDTPPSCRQKRRLFEMINLARLALLLARSFADRFPEIDWASIGLDDFQIDAVEPGGDGPRLAPGTRRYGPPPGRALLRMDIARSSTGAIGERGRSEEESIRILGKFLYSVFARGGSFPSDLLGTATPVAGRGATEGIPLDLLQTIEAMAERGSAENPEEKKSMLSELIDSDSFPVSICRLISDMVDNGPKGQSSHPLGSLGVVIQDLEHMVSRPELFLHDPCSPCGAPSQQIFGQACHGREKELAAVRSFSIRMEQSLHARLESPNSCCLNAVFVSGIAGSGKSHLVQAVASMLGPGWIVAKAKFERGKEHASRGIVSSMFDQLLINFVKWKESGSPSETACSRQVSNSILRTVGYDALHSLVGFLPSLALLFDGLGGDKTRRTEAEDEEFRLVYSISTIIKAILESGQLIMICCDDLQWADKTSLSFISEILINVGSLKHVCSRFLFVGLFRHNEIDIDHPFAIQYARLHATTGGVKVTEIELSSLSKKDISDMLMVELRLPQRFVAPLADAVHKKTSGHAIFVVEMLNSLLRSSVIAYSPREQRYDWDQDAVELLQPGDGVAALIASNLKGLPATSQRKLQILSCFGIQTDISLLKLLEGFQEGIICSLDGFIDMGILDRAGPIVIFTHDLIQQAVYESASLAEMHQLHFGIGLFLGGRAYIGLSATADPLTTTLDQIQLDDQEFHAGKTITSSLISLACDQIDSVALDMFTDEEQRAIFAEWNLYSGKQMAAQYNHHATVFYFSKGISFLGEDCWRSKHFKLCLALHKGAVMASFKLGEPLYVAQHAECITSNSSFEDSLEIQPIVLMSLAHIELHEECISRGIQMLHRLNFDIPLSPSFESLVHIVSATDSMASKFSMDQMMTLCEKSVDISVHRVIQIVDAITASCFATSSLITLFVACAAVRVSLQHGICHESTLAFAVFGMIKILYEDYSGGKRWADVTRAIVRKHATTNFRPIVIIHMMIDIWFVPHRDIAQEALCNHQNALRKGFVDAAMFSLNTGWRLKLLGGERLSLLCQSSEDRLRLLTKHSHYAAKFGFLDNILLMELTGRASDCFPSLRPSDCCQAVNTGTASQTRCTCDLNDILESAKSSKDSQLLHCCHVTNAMIQYWRGNYTEAGESSRLAFAMLLASKMPTIHLIYHTFFRGLILFQLYRMNGDRQTLSDGKEMMHRMEKWALVSMAVFENKWLLLTAEYCSSIKDFNQAKRMYEGSIKSAQDHGNIHELALGYELLGKFYSERGSKMTSDECFKKAYVYYTQWGATAVAEKVLRVYNLDSQALHALTQKRKREAN